jgi:hypothetical protein
MEQAKLQWAERRWGAGGTIFFRVLNSLEGCDGWGEGRGLLYLTMVVQWKDIRPCRPEFGPKGKHFVSGNSLFFYFWGMNEKQRSCDGGWGARSALFGVAMNPKKTGAHSARARTRGQNPLVLHNNRRAISSVFRNRKDF